MPASCIADARHVVSSVIQSNAFLGGNRYWHHVPTGVPRDQAVHFLRDASIIQSQNGVTFQLTELGMSQLSVEFLARTYQCKLKLYLFAFTCLYFEADP